jgi:hypothetical protein
MRLLHQAQCSRPAGKQRTRPPARKREAHPLPPLTMPPGGVVGAGVLPGLVGAGVLPGLVGAGVLPGAPGGLTGMPVGVAPLLPGGVPGVPLPDGPDGAGLAPAHRAVSHHGPRCCNDAH